MLCSSRRGCYTGNTSVFSSVMDKLKSEQEKVSLWLSSDPDYILDQCGDILSMNEWKEVQKQTNALQKTKTLLNIIIHKGRDSCQIFLGILRQNEGRYKGLHQFFNPPAHGLSTPTVIADDSSVVMVREITNTSAKSLSIKAEVERKPGGNPPSGLKGAIWNAVPLQAGYTANDSSVICADRITDVNIDGDINLSVSIRPSQPNPGTANETGPSPQGRAVKWIIEHKVELIACLRADLFILQHAHARRIVTDGQYDNLKHSSPPETTVTNLIDLVTGKGEESCEKFLQILKEPDVMETYPQLENILNFDASQL